MNSTCKKIGHDLEPMDDSGDQICNRCGEFVWAWETEESEDNMKLQTFKNWVLITNEPLNLRMTYEAGQHSVLEYIHQKTDDSCPCCDSESYPVDKNGKQIYTQNPETFQVEHAIEWNCDHDEDCLVRVIEKSLMEDGDN